MNKKTVERLAPKGTTTETGERIAEWDVRTGNG